MHAPKAVSWCVGHALMPLLLHGTRQRARPCPARSPPYACATLCRLETTHLQPSAAPSFPPTSPAPSPHLLIHPRPCAHQSHEPYPAIAAASAASACCFTSLSAMLSVLARFASISAAPPAMIRLRERKLVSPTLRAPESKNAAWVSWQMDRLHSDAAARVYSIASCRSSSKASSTGTAPASAYATRMTSSYLVCSAITRAARAVVATSDGLLSIAMTSASRSWAALARGGKASATAASSCMRKHALPMARDTPARVPAGWVALPCDNLYRLGREVRWTACNTCRDTGAQHPRHSSRLLLFRACAQRATRGAPRGCPPPYLRGSRCWHDTLL